MREMRRPNLHDIFKIKFNSTKYITLMHVIALMISAIIKRFGRNSEKVILVTHTHTCSVGKNYKLEVLKEINKSVIF